MLINAQVMALVFGEGPEAATVVYSGHADGTIVKWDLATNNKVRAPSHRGLGMLVWRPPAATTWATGPAPPNCAAPPTTTTTTGRGGRSVEVKPDESGAACLDSPSVTGPE